MSTYGPSNSEEIGHTAVDNKEWLRLTLGFEAPHLSLALPSTLVRYLSSIIGISLCAVRHRRRDISLRGPEAVKVEGYALKLPERG